MLKAQYQTRSNVPHEVIEAVELQLPAPGAGQVRIKVLAAPINPSDVLTLTGEYGMLPPLPAIGGNDASGIDRLRLPFVRLMFSMSEIA